MAWLEGASLGKIWAFQVEVLACAETLKGEGLRRPPSSKALYMSVFTSTFVALILWGNHENPFECWESDNSYEGRGVRPRQSEAEVHLCCWSAWGPALSRFGDSSLAKAGQEELLELAVQGLRDVKTCSAWWLLAFLLSLPPLPPPSFFVEWQ